MTSTPINQLATITLQSDLQSNDLLRLYSQRFGGEIGLSLVMLVDYVRSQASAGTLTTQYATPTATGFNVGVTQGDTWLVITPDAGYAAGTITLPTASQGQDVLVACTQSVASLTVSAQPGDVVLGAPNALAANDTFRLKYESVLKRWYRIT